MGQMCGFFGVIFKEKLALKNWKISGFKTNVAQKLFNTSGSNYFGQAMIVLFPFNIQSSCFCSSIRNYIVYYANEVNIWFPYYMYVA